MSVGNAQINRFLKIGNAFVLTSRCGGKESSKVIVSFLVVRSQFEKSFKRLIKLSVATRKIEIVAHRVSIAVTKPEIRLGGVLNDCSVEDDNSAFQDALDFLAF